MNTCDYVLCFPSMENGVNCHGKSWKCHGILLSDFCGNHDLDGVVGVRYERRHAAVTTSPADILTRAVLRLVWPFDGIVQN